MQAKQMGGPSAPACPSFPPQYVAHPRPRLQSLALGREQHRLSISLLYPGRKDSFLALGSRWEPLLTSFSLCFLWLKPVHKCMNVPPCRHTDVYVYTCTAAHRPIEQSMFINTCIFIHANVMLVHPACTCACRHGGLGGPFACQDTDWGHTYVYAHDQLCACMCVQACRDTHAGYNHSLLEVT